ncbi:MAG: hypothetical protein KF785_12750 [Gemmatimonadales bacterium]|nr:hypothetical protein [Gemmatimonadales bacterium]
MNKRLWISVGTVAGGLGVVSVASRWNELAQWWTGAGPALAAIEQGLGAARWPALLAAATLLAIGVTATLWRKRRQARGGFAEPWRTVIEMSKKGQGASVIAQATGLPQDAVRIMLGPIAVDPTFPGGKSFRSSQPDAAQPVADRQPAVRS